MRAALLATLLVSLGACADYQSQAATGDTCTSDADCPNGRCVTATDDPRVRYCSEVCAGAGYCPEGMQCIDSACRYPRPSPGSMGAACTGNADCLDDMCYVADGTSGGVCTITCPADGCPNSYDCQDTAAGQVCLSPASTAGDGCSTTGSRAGRWLVLVALALVLRLRHVQSRMR